MTAQILEHPAARTDAAEWWRGAVIYQVYPRSFADTNGDGVGDLAGVAAHLEHIASLGVDGIWLSPFFTSPMKDFGYDVADYCDVDPIFGSLADFDRLIARAHELGLKIITDLVFAHTSDKHVWFEESRQSRINPKADWFVWADARADGSPPSNWQSVFGGPAWTWDARRGQYYMHNFLPEQPQLNLHNPDVQDALLDAARFWLDRGVDGFRFDAINFSMHDPKLTDNPPLPPGGKRTRPFDFQDKVHNQSQPGIVDFLARVRALTDSYGGRFSVAEVGGDHAEREMEAFTQGDDHLNSAYGFLYLYAPALGAALVREGAEAWHGRDGQGWPSWTFSNHDAPRAISRWAEGRDPRAFAEMAMLLLMTLRGNVFIYQGEELALPQAEVPFDRLADPEAIANWPQTLGRDGARTPIPWAEHLPQAGFSTVEPWLPVDPRHIALSVDRQERDPSSMLHATRRLVAFRKAHPALVLGEMTLADRNDDLLAFERVHDGERLVCVFNLGHTPVAWTLPEGHQVLEAVNLDPSQSGVLPPMAGLVLAAG
ncbi:MAG: alpha-amylase family glycosyl hydrolase [Brevundimonas sp.]|uniref:alpha-amylase family glycosyl hydrolase n=1 Tax=Brevundimonas sp. TaxID=1871086 RepID=UPI0024898C74|nr:alpha-amylase family glycosyl hydrolase [Brevundimonas sp.]MDI1325543.1 alpha-amylase family glycosyl hydrolase [Brevundimonas sp.]